MLSSHREGTPLSLLEAIACGLPIAATAVGGVPDLLLRTFEGPVDARTYRELERPRGVLVAPGDAPALAAALAERPARGPASPRALRSTSPACWTTSSGSTRALAEGAVRPPAG